LEAIHKLENPENLPHPGPFGELGAYQFRASTWRMHTSMPFSQAVVRWRSDLVAVEHYEWIRRGLERARMKVTPYNIALAWNCGLGATVSGKAPRVAHNYAQRASNLAAMYRRTAAQTLAGTTSATKPQQVAATTATDTPPLLPVPASPILPAKPATPTANPRFVVSTDDPPLAVYLGGPRFLVSLH
jgi:hypothetical protein